MLSLTKMILGYHVPIELIYRPLASSSARRTSNSSSPEGTAVKAITARKRIFNHHPVHDGHHAKNFTPFFLGQLIAPVALDEICAVCGHSRDEALSSDKADPILSISFDLDYLEGTPNHSRSAQSNRILQFQADFDVDNSEHEQGRHGIIQDLPICPVQLGDSSQGEAKGHALEEIAMSAGFEEKRVRLVIRGRFRTVDKTVTHILFRHNSTIENAIGEVDKVGCKGKSPGAGNRCDDGASVWCQRMEQSQGRGLTKHLWDRDPNSKSGAHRSGGLKSQIFHLELLVLIIGVSCCCREEL